MPANPHDDGSPKKRDRLDQPASFLCCTCWKRVNGTAGTLPEVAEAHFADHGDDENNTVARLGPDDMAQLDKVLGNPPEPLSGDFISVLAVAHRIKKG